MGLMSVVSAVSVSGRHLRQKGTSVDKSDNGPEPIATARDEPRVLYFADMGPNMMNV